MDLLEELVAERDIRKALALYAHYADDLNAEDWVKLFTEDGVIVCGPKRLHGHAELRAWIAKVHSGPKLLHMMTNAAITIAGARISIWCRSSHSSMYLVEKCVPVIRSARLRAR